MNESKSGERRLSACCIAKILIARCRGADSRARRCTCSPYRPPSKWHAPIASVAALSERLVGVIQRQQGTGAPRHSLTCHCEAPKGPWQSRSTRPEHGKAFGESVSACHALSVTFGDSSPRGRAKVASLPAMTREGGACKFVTMPLRMGWVSPSCHCILPVAAGSQVCHCEPCGARRGNLAAPAGTRESFWRIRKCLPCPLSHLR